MGEGGREGEDPPWERAFPGAGTPAQERDGRAERLLLCLAHIAQ
ncbi:MAG: hypothetical protein AVDCRST_MAG68-4976 [uncultured Gemmatimonadetes bacterium]|uniref:Uncharacterized protein n=1 Tax=uncultured Gemmatimonadota bacterium TaxID=203437 RepID=A0A6J4MUQ1_9BACT|nr:MAG: hypothetical protein AVDCRST_MAG68-4976 [uncultured Gemmatimonadota bacterium]